MSDEVDQPATPPGRARAAALLLTAASASAALMTFAAPALSALPVAGPGSTRNHPAVAVSGDPCLVTVEGPGAAKAPTCAGD
jgi:hypothetical protein